MWAKSQTRLRSEAVKKKRQDAKNAKKDCTGKRLTNP